MTLYHDLKSRGVLLEADGERLLVDAPAGELTDNDRATLVKYRSILVKFLKWEGRKLDQAARLGCVARWSKYPTWIELHNPLTGEWHELKASECLPGVVAEADKHREEGGAA
jgi:TubC N-terminal docking domain